MDLGSIIEWIIFDGGWFYILIIIAGLLYWANAAGTAAEAKEKERRSVCLLCDETKDKIDSEIESFLKKYELAWKLDEYKYSSTGIKLIWDKLGPLGKSRAYPICIKCLVSLDMITEGIWKDGGWIKPEWEDGKKIIEYLNSDLETLKNKVSEYRTKKLENFLQAQVDSTNEEIERELERKDALRNSIIELLKEKNIKMPVSDIDAFLKHQNVDEIKEFCEELYNDGEISFAGNGRYFVLTEGQEKPKKTSAPKSEEVDVEKELEKLKGLLDKGLITQEDYDAKKKVLLGL